MNNVVVMFLDGKEVLFENARFIVTHDINSVKICTRASDKLIAVFNFNNIAGVKAI